MSAWPAIPRKQQTGGQRSAAQRVTIQAWTFALSVSPLLGPEGAVITGGYGNWELLERPRNSAITEWRGRTNYELTLDVIFDAWLRAPQGAHVENEIRKLEQLATTQAGMVTPTSVRVSGPVPWVSLRWVIASIEWGDFIRSSTTGRRVRQQATIKLVEYVAPTDLVKLPRAKAAPTGTRKYTIRKGDDLKKIAQRTLGKSSRWREIVKLNKGLRGVKLPAKFKAGTKIKVPRK